MARGRPQQRLREASQQPGLAGKASKKAPSASLPRGSAGLLAKHDKLAGPAINPSMATVAAVGEIASR